MDPDPHHWFNGNFTLLISFFWLNKPSEYFFIVTGDEEARATTGEGSKQGTTETTPANRGEIGYARPSNTHYLNLIFLKNGLNIILSTYFVFYILKSSKHKQRQTKICRDETGLI